MGCARSLRAVAARLPTIAATAAATASAAPPATLAGLRIVSFRALAGTVLALPTVGVALSSRRGRGQGVDEIGLEIVPPGLPLGNIVRRARQTSCGAAAPVATATGGTTRRAARPRVGDGLVTPFDPLVVAASAATSATPATAATPARAFASRRVIGVAFSLGFACSAAPLSAFAATILFRESGRSGRCRRLLGFRGGPPFPARLAATFLVAANRTLDARTGFTAPTRLAGRRRVAAALDAEFLGQRIPVTRRRGRSRSPRRGRAFPTWRPLRRGWLGRRGLAARSGSQGIGEGVPRIVRGVV